MCFHHSVLEPGDETTQPLFRGERSGAGPKICGGVPPHIEGEVMYQGYPTGGDEHSQGFQRRREQAVLAGAE